MSENLKHGLMRGGRKTSAYSIGSVRYNTIKSDLESGINTKILSFTVKISRARIKLGNIFSCVNNG